MPKLPPSNLPPPDPNNPAFNPLFFGDFTRMGQDQFETLMGEIMSSHERTYAAQVRELYLLGNFLAKKKYRYLRLAYISFIVGLSATFLCFIVLALI